MICLDCQNLNIHDVPTHAKMGLGKCKHGKSGEFVSISFDRLCEKFSATTEEVSFKRKEWRNKENEKLKQSTTTGSKK